MDIFEKVQKNARETLRYNKAQASNLFIQKEILPQGHVIEAQHEEIPLKQNTVMVFSDDAPLYNWAHPCRYMLYDEKDGELYEEVKANFPPYLIKPPETYEAFHEPVRWPDTDLLKPIIPKLRFVWRVPKGKRYAVLFSGASNNRHVNDLEFLYRTLIDIYNFPSRNIFVLNYDGTINYSRGPKPVVNWPGDSTAYRMRVNGQGTKSEMEGVFNALKTRLSSDDFLLIHTNNHGGHNGTESYLCTYSGSSYLASDFAAKLGELPQIRCLMVMMEQCHSGGFNAPIIASSPSSGTSVASACEEHRSSIGGANFDPFARDWIAAVNDADPYGTALASNPDTDGSGKVSAKEAFDYADSIHHSYDTPVYNESCAAAGDCHLGKIWKGVWWPWWYRKIVLERLLPYREVMPDPELYERIYEKLLPSLKEIGTHLDERSEELQRELEPRIEELIKEAME